MNAFENEMLPGMGSGIVDNEEAAFGAMDDLMMVGHASDVPQDWEGANPHMGDGGAYGEESGEQMNMDPMGGMPPPEQFDPTNDQLTQTLNDQLVNDKSSALDYQADVDQDNEKLQDEDAQDY